MVEGLLKRFDPKLNIFSAGTKPALAVHPKAIAVMKEIGIDISAQQPKLVDEFLNEDFDYVITVCDHAKETCPFFTGKVKNRLHMGFEDPAQATGSEAEILARFRMIRDQMQREFQKLYQSIVN
jgi:arsenate reductase